EGAELMWPFSDRTTLPVQVATVQLTAELPNKRGIGFTVSILKGEDLDSINAKLDLAQDAIERQRSRCEIPELEAKRDQMMKGLDEAREVLADLEGRRQKGEQLSSQERQNINNLRVNIQKVQEEIEKGAEAIQEAKRKAGVG